MSENKINPNDTAFPFICDGYVSGGVTLRQYFAAMAASGIATHFPEFGNAHAYETARRSVEIADALIAALNQEQAP